MRGIIWQEGDITRLQQLWLSSPRPEILIAFSGRTWKSLVRKAEQLGLRRKRLIFNETVALRPYKIPGWLIGEMLGDGHITVGGQYSHTTKYREYADFLAKKFWEMGMKVCVWDDERVEERTGATYRRSLLKTRAYFTEFRKEWYPNGEKRVPSGLRVTDEVFAHWMMGDGSIGVAPYLGTTAFSSECILELRELLAEYGIGDTSVRPSSNVISILKTEGNQEKIRRFVTNFTRYPHCYKYKFEELRSWSVS